MYIKVLEPLRKEQCYMYDEFLSDACMMHYMAVCFCWLEIYLRSVGVLYKLRTKFVVRRAIPLRKNKTLLAGLLARLKN
jgi:hypothetical protein